MKLSYKSVFDWHVRGKTNKNIADSLQTTKKTVRRIIGKAEKLRLLHDAYLAYEKNDLKAKMKPRRMSKKSFHPANWAKIHEELTRWGSKCSDLNHTTMALLYSEYTVEAEMVGKETN